jgi:hypothetical protein
MANNISAKDVFIPKKAITINQNIEPGPPICTAVATPAIQPIPITDDKLVNSDCSDLSKIPSTSSSLSSIIFVMAYLKYLTAGNFSAKEKYNPVIVNNINKKGKPKNS